MNRLDDEFGGLPLVEQEREVGIAWEDSDTKSPKPTSASAAGGWSERDATDAGSVALLLGEASEDVNVDVDAESEDADELHPSDERTFQTRIEFESDTYGCASVVSAYFWMDKSNITWAFWRMVSQMVNLITQVFLLYVTKEFVTFPSVLKARALYARYHADVFVDGTFDSDKWDAWDHKSALCQLPLSNKQFTFVMLCTWTSTVLLDIKQTFRFAKAWWDLPNTTSKKKRLVIEVEEDRKAVVRAPLGLKAFVFIIILLPKLCIAILTWWIGCRWLITTLHFSDVILNSVALMFILEIDELLYQTLEPHEVQEWVVMHDIVSPSIFTGRLDPSLRGSARCREMRLIRLHYSMKVFVMTAAVCFGVPALYMVFQQAIPGYKWDVAVHCAGYVEEHWGG